ncbi:MAG: hypothetical protein JW876_11275 [Candidatus Krumholzibacteriota bacterium]|nr:hypothetical protein [Candidatus Krumholzibacteriota bacterium]
MPGSRPGAMTMRHGHGVRRFVIPVLILAAALAANCSDEAFVGEATGNLPPEVWLSSGPVEGDTTGYQVHFYWGGWDPDGEIDHFEFVIADGRPYGFDPEDTTGLDKWFRTASYDSVIRVAADESPRPYNPLRPQDSLYTRYDRTHTFFLRAVDLQGKRSDAVHRSFTAWTLAPFVTITDPRLQTGSKEQRQSYSTVITFAWEGRDPIDSPSNAQDPDSIRFLVMRKLDFEQELYCGGCPVVTWMNRNPERYERYWGPWVYYRAPEDSGRTTIIGDDEILSRGEAHIFAVQAKDEAGAVTAVFEKGTNVREFVVSVKQGPLLSVSEPFLGTDLFLGERMNPVKKELPPGVPLNFVWEANASDYGGRIVGYRYGWDVEDLKNPDDWAVSMSPYHREAPERSFYVGTHTFYVQVVDDGNRYTLGQIQVEIIPFTMERNLLLVDDFNSDDTPKPLREMPTESEHDAFWLDICGVVDEFYAERDVFDCQLNGIEPPPIRTVAHYKNIIWVYSASSDAFRSLIRFSPVSNAVQGGTTALNYLALFIARGGHLWTLGRGERGGGLASTFLEPPLFPASFKFDHDYRSADDTSGVNCMPYKDYCLRAVDKVMGSFQVDPVEIPPDFLRSLDRDALRFAVRDAEDPVSALFAGMPDTLRLWTEITQPGLFFDPAKRGLYYVECYDPQYYLDFKLLPGHLPCFHALYRMRARNARSLLEDATVAVVVDRYGHIRPEVQSGVSVAASSFHFGVPLWFFDHDSVRRIAAAIFDEWQILAPETEASR